jgi:hypothetical protein
MQQHIKTTVRVMVGFLCGVLELIANTESFGRRFVRLRADA